MVGEYAQADRAQAETGDRRGARGVPAWSHIAAAAALDILDKAGTAILARKDELGKLLAREEGKTLPEGIGEAMRAGQIFKFFAGEALRMPGEKIAVDAPGHRVEVTREPVGVVGIITPWNFPIAIPAWKIAPALAYGNCVVFKPADLVPGCALGAGQDPRRCGAAQGRVQPRHGPRLGGRRGDARRARRSTPSASPGSVATGREIAQKAVARGKKVQLEMGGKNPLVVLDDADLGIAVGAAVNGAFFSTGQRCTASIAPRSSPQGIHDKFVGALRREDEGAQGRQRAQARHRDRPGRRRRRSSSRTMNYIEIARRRRRQGRTAASASTARRRASTSRRRWSPKPPTRCASTARRCSARSRA